MTTTSLADAHRELVERCQMADAVDDWRERTLLAPLVDVADYVKRVGDHPDSAHYRAEKAGRLMQSAIAVQCQALMAYAGWPEKGPACATIDEAHSCSRPWPPRLRRWRGRRPGRRKRTWTGPVRTPLTSTSCDQLPEPCWLGPTVRSTGPATTPVPDDGPKAQARPLQTSQQG